MTISLAKPLEIRHRLPPLRALTTIRFFAAIYVVLFHESHWKGHISLFPFAARLVNSGYTAVTLFFVLSGFILAYNYAEVKSKREFWVSRFARIYPVYFLALLPPLLITPHWSYHPRPGAIGVVLTFLLLQGWWRPLCFSLNMAAWTLSVEAFFYAVFPFLLPWTERLRRRGFLAIQIAWLALVCLPPLLAHSQVHAGSAVYLADWLESSIPLARINAFFLGMYAGIQFRRSLTSGNGPAKEGGMRRGRTAAFVALVAVIVALLWLNPGELLLPLRTEGLQVCYAVLLTLLAPVTSRILTNHVSQIAGEISYSVYILQFPVLFMFDDAMGRMFPRLGHVSVLYIAVLCLISYLSFRFVETPARILIRRAFTHRPVPVRVV